MSKTLNTHFHGKRDSIANSKTKINHKWDQDPFRKFKLLKTEVPKERGRPNFIQRNINKVCVESENLKKQFYGPMELNV